MSEDQFTKLYNYMQKEFASIKAELATKSSQDSIDRLINTIDSFVKRLDTAEIETASRDAQFDRLLQWAKEVSKKTGVPLRDL